MHGDREQLAINGRQLGYSRASSPGEVPWHELGVEIMLECTGRFRTAQALEAYFEQGVRRVIVAAPVKEGALNGTVLLGVIYEWQGLSACLWASAGFVLAAGALSLLLPR